MPPSVNSLHAALRIRLAWYAYSKLLSSGLRDITEDVFLKLLDESLLIHREAVLLIGLPGVSANSAQALRLILLCHWILIVKSVKLHVVTLLSQLIKHSVSDELCEYTSFTSSSLRIELISYRLY